MNIFFKSASSIITSLCVIIGGIMGYLIGSIDGLVYCLIVFMVIDYITGVVVAALVDKSLSSSVGFLGIAKKVMIIFLVIISNMLDVYIIGSGSAARTAVISFYLINEGISIIENISQLGIPIPSKLLNLFDNIENIKEKNHQDEN